MDLIIVLGRGLLSETRRRRVSRKNLQDPASTPKPRVVLKANNDLTVTVLQKENAKLAEQF